ncbi:MAG: O-antigen ligase family protein [Terriglobales bacterium]
MDIPSIPRPRRKLIRAPGGGERFFTVFVLLLSTTAFTNLMGSEDSAPGTGALAFIMQSLWSAIYLTAWVLMQRGCPKGFLGVVRRDKLLFLLVALTMVSVSWSDDPAFTFRRSVALMGTTLFGVYFARRYSLSDQLRLLSHVFLSAAILSPVFVAILPHYGLADPMFGYAWQGIYGHKNGLGAAMALGVVVFIFRAVSDRQKSLRWWGAVGLALFLLWMSHSSTGLVACAFTVSALIFSPALRWTFRKAVLFFLGVGLLATGVVLWAINHMAFVLSMVSRDSSFTGRTTVWLVSVAMIARHPWIGYGYNEAWPSYGSDIVARLTGLPGMSHAHNAVLNLWLDLGLMGVVVFILQYFKSLWRAVVVVRDTKTFEWLWPLVFLLFLAAYGLVESVVLQRNGLSWILFTAVVVQVSSRACARPSAVTLSPRNRAAA